jgi:GNAT superfamily N-acetyltransferase
MIQIRDAESNDAGLLLQLIREMGTQERMPVLTTEERLRRDGFGSAPKYHAFIAQTGTQVAGYALAFNCYSSFQGSGLFLEDLFVRNEFRAQGVGKLLLSRVAVRAVELGCFGIMLNVLDWNEPALKFFERAGASVLTERKTLSLTARSLEEIAEFGFACPAQ